MNNYNFNVQATYNELITWVRDWFDKNGKGCNVVIGMSGGKDSTICAKLLADAIGANRVIGVGMPDVAQGYNEAEEISNYLGIHFVKMPIALVTSTENVLWERLAELNPGVDVNFNLSIQSAQNTPPRVRMLNLYRLSQSNNGRVVNTCNLSENWIGYSTRYGDDAGDFSPFGNLTVTEILALGDYMGIPYEWVHKTPDDGLPHSSPDEEKLGFSYADLDKWIREGIKVEGHCNDDETKELRQAKIDRMHIMNLFKLKHMDTFNNVVK